jgi:hypothetical protein
LDSFRGISSLHEEFHHFLVRMEDLDHMLHHVPWSAAV